MENREGLDFLHNVVKDNSVDLILTDPPYVISHNTGLNDQYVSVRSKGDQNMKTEEDWEKYKETNQKKFSEKQKENFLKYGTIYGKKYAVSTDYGDWDHTFTMDTLDAFVRAFYKKLRKGGTLILWFDLWKLSHLKDIMESAGFKQIRMIEWIKTNPQPLNASVNYLTNCREIALTGVKDGKPTFNGRMERGIYEYPMASGKLKFHPTQKNLQLFEELIRKHSNENDLVMDTFLGGGTTAYAAFNTGRRFTGCEANKEYFERLKTNLKTIGCSW